MRLGTKERKPEMRRPDVKWSPSGANPVGKTHTSLNVVADGTIDDVFVAARQVIEAVQSEHDARFSEGHGVECALVGSARGIFGVVVRNEVAEEYWPKLRAELDAIRVPVAVADTPASRPVAPAPPRRRGGVLDAIPRPVQVGGWKVGAAAGGNMRDPRRVIASTSATPLSEAEITQVLEFAAKVWSGVAAGTLADWPGSILWETKVSRRGVELYVPAGKVLEVVDALIAILEQKARA